MNYKGLSTAVATDILHYRRKCLTAKKFHHFKLSNEIKILRDIKKTQKTIHATKLTAINTLKTERTDLQLNFHTEIRNFQDLYSMDALNAQHDVFLNDMAHIRSHAFKETEVLQSSDIVRVENDIFELKEELKCIESELLTSAEIFELYDCESPETAADKIICEEMQIKINANRKLINDRKIEKQKCAQMGAHYSYSAVKLDEFSGLTVERFEVKDSVNAAWPPQKFTGTTRFQYKVQSDKKY